MSDERLRIPEGIPELKRETREKKRDVEEEAAAEGSPGAGGEGGPPA